LRIRLDQVRFEPFHFQETCSIPAASLERPELTELSPVSWEGRIHFAEPGFLLKARYRYQQSLTCNRCLKPIAEPVAGDLELMIFVAAPRPLGGEQELDENDLGVLYLQDENLETEPLLVEQLQLNIPMKPLCRPDCAGLCPTCGADLNLGACECPSERSDPRWAGLQLLKDRLNERN
jgi:DUF177 domain-containing protein